MSLTSEDSILDNRPAGKHQMASIRHVIPSGGLEERHE